MAAWRTFKGLKSKFGISLGVQFQKVYSVSFYSNFYGQDTRCDKLRQHVVATSRLVYTAAATSRLRLVCSLVCTSLNLCDTLQRQNSSQQQ